MPGETASARRAWVVTDGAALERNLGKIRAALPPGVRYMAVVKADAYGHGAMHTVTRLLQCGVDCFCVANVREGADVRELGAGSEILVLGPVLPEEMPTLAEYGLTASISTPEEAAMLAALAKQRGRRIPVHVKVDTGMGRMGAWHEDAPSLIGAVLGQPALELCGAYTHFSCAGTDAGFTSLQRQRFVKALGTLPGTLRESPRFLVHADNSAGLETFVGGGGFNAVRVGLLQYGLPPRHDSLLARLTPERHTHQLRPDAHPGARHAHRHRDGWLRGRHPRIRQQQGTGAHPRAALPGARARDHGPDGGGRHRPAARRRGRHRHPHRQAGGR